ncbi:MAG: hypothetical protein JF599_11015 [Verrucomicrobia bacterium]|nr:hypothetical protein [Verrucomicrobiota bacterium]
MISPPAPTPAPSKRRSAWPRLSAKPEIRSVQIGVLATILVHLLLIWFAPRIERLIGKDDMSRTPTEADHTFDIQIAPDEFKQPPPPQKFVEANPNAPDNVPDKTNNFAAQNQQVAQEKPTPNHKSDTPALKGDKDPNVTALVTGQLAEPRPAAPPAPTTNTPPETPEQAAARREQRPLPGVEKIEGESPNGLGSNIAKLPASPTPTPERIEGSPDAKADQGATTGLYYTVDAKHPQSRKTLPANVVKARPSPLKNNEFGTDNIGAVAYDAKWSSYGEYLKKLIDTVQVQWERILDQSNVYPPAGTKVTVTFVLNSAGDISQIVKVESSGGLAAQSSCVSSITARAPYGPWTDDMIAALGTSQELTFNFSYY